MGSPKCRPQAPKGQHYIFRPWRTCPKTGRKLWASWFGLKAWPILVDDEV